MCVVIQTSEHSEHSLVVSISVFPNLWNLNISAGEVWNHRPTCSCVNIIIWNSSASSSTPPPALHCTWYSRDTRNRPTCFILSICVTASNHQLVTGWVRAIYDRRQLVSSLVEKDAEQTDVDLVVAGDVLVEESASSSTPVSSASATRQNAPLTLSLLRRHPSTTIDDLSSGPRRKSSFKVTIPVALVFQRPVERNSNRWIIAYCLAYTVPIWMD